jgi:hypothetical protein
MPAPSAEHAPILREMSEEILEVKPKASFFSWHVLEHDGFKQLKSPQVYITAIHDDAGQWIGGESLSDPANKIVAKYQERLGWQSREEGIGFAYSVKEAREITDLEGTGTLDPDFEGRPGLEMFSY